MNDIYKKYLGVTANEYNLLPIERQEQLKSKATQDNSDYFEFISIPTDFTWSLWQYCKFNKITAKDLIDTYEDKLKK